MVSHHIAFLGAQISSASEDIYLICHVTSHNHFFDGHVT